MNIAATAFRIEPAEWFVVFHRQAAARWIEWLAMGEFKHVSAFGYCAGVKAWVVVDVQWGGTRVWLGDQAAMLEWSQGCVVLRLARTDAHMGLSSRLGFTCVAAVKHLLGLRCVAATPTQLYRHILRSGGIPIHGQRPAPDPCRPEPAG